MGGWVTDFWTSGIFYMLIHTISVSTAALTQLGQKVDCVSFGKNC